MQNKIQEVFERVFPNCQEPKDWSVTLAQVLPDNEIDTNERVAAFLAQCGHESAGWSTFSENLNYSEGALKAVFGKYFSGPLKASDYARKPEKIANVVYANRMGNGPTPSGDGWKYRGRGPIQLTGKNNYTNFSREFSVNVVEEPQLVEKNKKISIQSAIWYWNNANLNPLADEKDIKTMTRKINGGYNGLEERQRLFDRCLSILEEQNGDLSDEDLVTIRLGDTGIGVEMVQEALGLTADGIFGPNTEKAIKKWQSDRGLVADGIVGPITMGKIFS